MIDKDPYIRRARWTKTVDGDTAHLVIDLGWYIYAEHTIRLLGVDTPELRGVDRLAGLESKAFSEFWFKTHQHDLDWPLLIRSEKADSFGRFLADVQCSVDNENLAEILLDKGLAKEYTR